MRPLPVCVKAARNLHMNRVHACLFKPPSPCLASWDSVRVGIFFVLGRLSTYRYRRTIYRTAARALQILDLPDSASRYYTFSTYMTLAGYDLRLNSGPCFFTAWSRRSWEMTLVSGKADPGMASRNGPGVGEGFATPSLRAQKGPHASSSLLRGSSGVHEIKTSR